MIGLSMHSFIIHIMMWIISWNACGMQSATPKQH